MDIEIDGFKIGKETYIIAEISANHSGDINIAKQSILAAKNCGANAVKIQTYTADTLTIDCDNECFVVSGGTLWDNRTLYDLYKEAYTPWEWHKELFEYAKEVGITIFSTPFDKTAVDLLEQLNAPAYKVASFEITDTNLIEYIASKGKPVIISTGIATLGEIEDAVNACKKQGNHKIILLKCTSAYPAKIEDANIATMVNMKNTFATEIGLSDHTVENTTAIVAVALGAKVVEKHFILNKDIQSVDADFSLTQEEFTSLVSDIRNSEKAFGVVDYSINEKKSKSRAFARSLFVVEDIKEGEVFTEKNIKSIRPSNGISPKYLNNVLGKKATINIKRGTPLSFNHFK